MLTDIFEYRYFEQPIWSQYTEIEQRLLNQVFGIVKDALPYNNISINVWKTLHDQLARELGVDRLSKVVFANESWVDVCDHFVNDKCTDSQVADHFIKERISFVELALRQRGEQVARDNSQLKLALFEAKLCKNKLCFRSSSKRTE